MTMNTSIHTIPARMQALLRNELTLVQRWLNGFEPMSNGRARQAWLGVGGAYMIIEGMPLPEGYQPDHIDLMIDLSQFPTIPPIGLYVLNQQNGALIEQLKKHFRAFTNAAFHDAESVEGYTWICYHYANNQWKHNAAQPNKGDNIAKFFNNFYTELDK
jgi:hypothetical protein